MKIDPAYTQSPSHLSSRINTDKTEIIEDHPTSLPRATESDLLAPFLNRDFYQRLQAQGINDAKKILNFLNQYDVMNDGNQTVKENRQRSILMYAHQQSVLDNTENKEAINQSLISFLSYQGFYHQVTLDLLGMTDNQEEYSDFFKPDSASFLF
ncbi:hypothetical protein [Proteus faecis]|uniref:hypothetical protein n=1 Tax=Proteus faecis TaxID=2050967 RepID=UPI000D693E4B|nr:hypothetical protein [Proteus faecis]